ncbi:MAG: HAMP domain-containing histidine kinase [Oscillospiraceae bacterium]|nr:HAMP domain-containing histidine kinase [Oscillospiraceae bacterium]
MSEELFHQDEPLSEVLQQVSSQLRLSLGNIHNALSRLAPPDLRDEQKGIDLDAAVLCQSYYRILRLTNNLSDASEPERPEGQGLSNDDIVGVCRSVMDRAAVPAELLGIRLEFRSAKASQIIAMDSERIERLLLNLLSNAFKFIGNGEKRVTLEVRPEPDYVYLTLSDTGRGIPAGQLDTVFDRCRQSRRLDPPPHGLGLGLPICRRIAREHGGSLILTSQEGKGAAVTVSLPNRRVPQMLKSPMLMDLTGGFNQTLVELSDALPKQAFTQKYLD